jgi:hypothetical protein
MLTTNSKKANSKQPEARCTNPDKSPLALPSGCLLFAVCCLLSYARQHPGAYRLRVETGVVTGKQENDPLNHTKQHQSFSS